MSLANSAKAMRQANSTYEKAWDNHFDSEVELLDDDRFWQIQEIFVKQLFRSGLRVEHAADELCRAAWCTEHKMEGVTLQDMARFAKTWTAKKDALYQPLFDVVEGKGDDGYGDFLDALPLAGREVYEACLDGDYGNNRVLIVGITTSLAHHEVAPQKYADKFLQMILNGENYIRMMLENAAKNFTASSFTHNVRVESSQVLTITQDRRNILINGSDGVQLVVSLEMNQADNEKWAGEFAILSGQLASEAKIQREN